jgi:L-aspartate oxidase
LLEGLVFSRRIANVLPAELRAWAHSAQDARTPGVLPEDVRIPMQKLMTEQVGVLRSASGLAAAASGLVELSGPRSDAVGQEEWETTNLVTISAALTAAASMREETRGSHWRDDFPDRDDAHWAGHFDVTLGHGAVDVTFCAAPASDTGEWS